MISILRGVDIAADFSLRSSCKFDLMWGTRWESAVMYQSPLFFFRLKATRLRAEETNNFGGRAGRTHSAGTAILPGVAKGVMTTQIHSTGACEASSTVPCHDSWETVTALARGMVPVGSRSSSIRPKVSEGIVKEETTLMPCLCRRRFHHESGPGGHNFGLII